VVDLWGLFNFALPGYLGNEAAFKARVGGPVARARAPAATAADVAAASAALAGLHRSLLPFVLRRLKGDVLAELPRKTVTDVVVSLAPAQRALYAAYVERTRSVWLHSHGGSQGDGGAPLSAAAADAPPLHLFAALALLRQVVGHPDLVPIDALPAPAACASTGSRTPRFALERSCKLTALRDLLLQLGFGGASGDGAGSDGEEGDEGEGEEGGGRGGGGAAEGPPPARKRRRPPSAAAAHAAPPPAVLSGRRMLVFSQLTGMLDAVEHGVLRRHFPALRFARLQGSTPAPEREATAAAFNSDATLSVLLATTAAGGLGLNLVGADTVVFLDHDWNPNVDAQAQDRAHRIGQTRPVAVYRVLARGTVEEAVMSQQAWKAGVAARLVGAANASLASGVGTAPLLELLAGAGEGGGGGGSGGGEGTARASHLQRGDEAWERAREEEAAGARVLGLPF
jgi:TATA-binding protein-associated factor